MSPLPEADAATRATFIAWLERFAGHVREVDYAAARPLFHPDILAFGTHRDIISGLAAWQATQWDNVWPKTSDFRFDTDTARILVSADNTMASVVVSWTAPAIAWTARRSIGPVAPRWCFTTRAAPGSARIRTCRSIAACRSSRSRTGR